jgi:hypothetical protein
MYRESSFIELGDYNCDKRKDLKSSDLSVTLVW